jgi:hypothetical protein
MLFNTFDFLAFFSVAFLVQLVLPHRPWNAISRETAELLFG